FFFSGTRRHTRSKRDWSSDVCSSDLGFEFFCLCPYYCFLLFSTSPFLILRLTEFSHQCRALLRGCARHGGQLSRRGFHLAGQYFGTDAGNSFFCCIHSICERLRPSNKAFIYIVLICNPKSGVFFPDQLVILTN